MSEEMKLIKQLFADHVTLHTDHEVIQLVIEGLETKINKILDIIIEKGVDG